MSKIENTAPVTAAGGSGLSGTVFVVFLILKLVGVIDWSWWWVTSPLWIPFLIGLAAGIIALIIVLMMVILEKISSR